MEKTEKPWIEMSKSERMQWAADANNRARAKAERPNFVFAFRLDTPAAADAAGRWMEENGASIAFRVMLGRYEATITWGRLLSYSDDRGSHRETRELSRTADTAAEAIQLALRAAIEIYSEG